MKNTENNKSLYRRYLDDLYTTEDARQLLNNLHDSDNNEILNELSSDVWEEAATQQPLTDLEREHYKREARQLLKRIEHKNVLGSVVSQLLLSAQQQSFAWYWAEFII